MNEDKLLQRLELLEAHAGDLAVLRYAEGEGWDYESINQLGRALRARGIDLAICCGSDRLETYSDAQLANIGLQRLQVRL